MTSPYRGRKHYSDQTKCRSHAWRGRQRRHTTQPDPAPPHVPGQSDLSSSTMELIVSGVLRELVTSSEKLLSVRSTVRFEVASVAFISRSMPQSDAADAPMPPFCLDLASTFSKIRLSLPLLHSAISFAPSGPFHSPRPSRRLFLNSPLNLVKHLWVEYRSNCTMSSLTVNIPGSVWQCHGSNAVLSTHSELTLIHNTVRVLQGAHAKPASAG